MTHGTTAPAVVRVSAQIIPLPTAASEPVIQQRRYGRFPREIVSLYRYRRDKNYAISQEYAQREKIEQHRASIANATGFLVREQANLAALMADLKATQGRRINRSS